MDKTNIIERMQFFSKTITYSIFTRKVKITIANLFSGIIFLLMGGLIAYYAYTDQLGMESSDGQLWMNITVSKITDVVTNVLSNGLAQWILILLFGLVFLFFAVKKGKTILGKVIDRKLK